MFPFADKLAEINSCMSKVAADVLAITGPTIQTADVSWGWHAMQKSLCELVNSGSS